MPRKYEEMIGKVFDKMTVLAVAGRSSGGHLLFRCRCDCGIEVIRRGNDLRSGKTHSCGGVGCKNRGVYKPRVKKEKPEMEAKKDCFAYLQRQGGAVCTALNEVYCKKGECKFYAPLKEVCSGCDEKCEKCLTVSHQKQMEK